MKTGVIGSGQISSCYLKNMINEFPNLEVTKIASLHFENAAKKAAEFGLIPCTVDELLADPEIEIIVNLTPTEVHYELIKKALLAGKHVYTEKTLTMNSFEAEELCKIADEKGLYLCCAPDTFLGASIQTVKKAIEDGLLGEINSFAISANRNNDRLLSFHPFLLVPGTGIIKDYAVYYMTALVYLLGKVKKVGSIVKAPYKEHININPDSPDYGKTMYNPNESRVSAIFEMENGATGTFHIDGDSSSKDRAYFAIYGKKGILYLGDPNAFGGEVRYVSVDCGYKREDSIETLPFVSRFSFNARGIGVSDMASAIEEERTPKASKEMACHVLKVLEAILKGGDGAFTEV